MNPHLAQHPRLPRRSALWAERIGTAALLGWWIVSLAGLVLQ